MQDFSIQVLATLVSTLIIFGINQLVKIIKTIPTDFWHYFIYYLALILVYLFDVNNIIVHIKYLTNATLNFNFKYMIILVSFSFCLYITIDLATFIKKEFSNYKSNNQK